MSNKPNSIAVFISIVLATTSLPSQASKPNWDWVGQTISAVMATVLGCSTEAEEKFIDDIVNNALTDEQIRENFYVFPESSTDFRNAEIIILGEYHSDAESLVLKEKALQSLVAPGDIILHEGHEAGGCSKRDLLFSRFEAMKARRYNAREALDYDVLRYALSDDSFGICARDSLLSNKVESLARLSVARAVCGAWDQNWSFWKVLMAKSDLFVSKRNSILAKCLKNVTECSEDGESIVNDKSAFNDRKKPRVFVTAGALHTPWGERQFCLDLARKNKGCRRLLNGRCLDGFFSPKIDDEELAKKGIEQFYSAFERIFAYEDDWRGECGSTKPIYEALKNRSYAVLIPKKVFDSLYLQGQT